MYSASDRAVTTRPELFVGLITQGNTGGLYRSILSTVRKTQTVEGVVPTPSFSSMYCLQYSLSVTRLRKEPSSSQPDFTRNRKSLNNRLGLIGSL